MNWTDLLKIEIEATYGPTEGLMKLVAPEELSWKPETGTNWMTTGQLVKHLTTACGWCCRGFVTGDWGMPEGECDASPEDMLPPAEKLPTVETVEQALVALAEDKVLAFQMVEKAGEKELASRMVAAPWCPGAKSPLGRHLLQMIGHLGQHMAALAPQPKRACDTIGRRHGVTDNVDASCRARPGESSRRDKLPDVRSTRPSCSTISS